MRARWRWLPAWVLLLVMLAFGVSASAQTTATTMAPTPPAVARARAARDMVTEAPDGRALTIPAIPAGFTVERRGGLSIAYPPALEPALRGALRHVEADVRSLSEQLGIRSLPPLEIRLVSDPDAMRALAPVEAPPPAYAVGVAYPSLRLTLVSASAPRTWEASDVRRVLRHELSHLLLGIATNNAPLPRWFSEGVAIEQAAEHSFERFEELARASVTRSLIPLRELDGAFSEQHNEVNLAYAQSADFVGFLLRRDGPARLGVFASHVRDGAVFDEALRRTWGMSLANAELSWREDVSSRHLLLPFVLGTGVLWGGSALLLFVAFVRARRRGRAVLKRWASEDAQADARAAVIPFEARAPSRVDGAVSPEPTKPKQDDVMTSGVVVFLPYARKPGGELPN